jgi:hypothetical protein
MKKNLHYNFHQNKIKKYEKEFQQSRENIENIFYISLHWMNKYCPKFHSAIVKIIKS